jgi:hypothetical protein
VKDHSNLPAALHQKTLSLQERLDIFKEGTMNLEYVLGYMTTDQYLCFLIVHIHTFLVFQQEIEHEQVFCQGIWLYIPGLTVGSRRIKIYDAMRIFTGNNPARQFECGQQRVGNYSCLCGIHVTDHSNLAAALPSMSLESNSSIRSFFFRLERGLMFEAEKCFHIVPSLKMSSLSCRDKVC